jgi:hypothetical protein
VQNSIDDLHSLVKFLRHEPWNHNRYSTRSRHACTDGYTHACMLTHTLHRYTYTYTYVHTHAESASIPYVHRTHTQHRDTFTAHKFFKSHTHE